MALKHGLNHHGLSALVDFVALILSLVKRYMLVHLAGHLLASGAMSILRMFRALDLV